MVAYSELMASLGGIATNLLADRLRRARPGMSRSQMVRATFVVTTFLVVFAIVALAGGRGP